MFQVHASTCVTRVVREEASALNLRWRRTPLDKDRASVMARVVCERPPLLHGAGASFHLNRNLSARCSGRSAWGAPLPREAVAAPGVCPAGPHSPGRPPL